jgi:two-component system, OmpR family, phosphate regulon sensor histidine kinase PhoR
MKRFWSFRKKIFAWILFVVIFFSLILFPLVREEIEVTLQDQMRAMTESIVDSLRRAKNIEEMVSILSGETFLGVERISLFNEYGKFIFDSRFPNLAKKIALDPEVQTALKEDSTIYQKRYEPTQSSSFMYIAIPFKLLGKNYLLRAAFSLKTVSQIQNQYQKHFILFVGITLFTFSGAIWLIFNHLSAPLYGIIQKIQGYQKGDRLPRIFLDEKRYKETEFHLLVQTFNSLSDQIQEQIYLLQKERNEKQEILESLGEGVLAIDSEQIILYANDTATKMLGIPKTQLIGRRIQEWRDKKENYFFSKIEQLLIQSEQQLPPIADVLITADGMRYLDLIVAPKKESAGSIVVIQDKTGQYRRVEIEKNFISNASHELRTPITIIRGFAETLRDLPHLSPETLHEMTEKIVQGCSRMESLIKSLLTLSDIEREPSKNFSPQNLVDIAEQCRTTLLSLHPEAFITIWKNQEEIFLNCNGELMQLAIYNLLDNAFKYSQPPAQITIEIENQEKQIRLSVRDKGLGIAPIDQIHIFERFYRVDKARSRRMGGAGLGLSIVKTIADLHGGSISLSSTPGEGSSFTLFFPIRLNNNG